MVNITVSTTKCIDTVEFYIDGLLKYTDTAAPFEYLWDTTTYVEGQHTISVMGYCAGVFQDSDTITVNASVPQFYIVITSPQEGDIVSGNVLITTDTYCIDTAKFYIDGKLKYTDKEQPFEYTWKTRGNKDGNHTITVEGYDAGVFRNNDQITVIVKNKSGIVLFSFLVLFLCGGIFYRKH